MKYGLLLAPLAVIAGMSPALATELVSGPVSPKVCYDAANAHARDFGSIRVCDAALADMATRQHDRVASLVNRGIIKQLRGDRADAIVDYDRALAADPREPEAWLNKGLAVLNLDDPATAAKALPLFEGALSLHTVRPEIAYYGRGMAHELGGDTRAAYADYLHAVAIAPDFTPAKQQLARFRVVAGGSS